MSDFAFTPPPPPSPPPVPPIPWERPGAGLRDLFATVTLVLGRPGEAFSRLSATTGIGRALVFGLIVYVLASAIGQLWNLALNQALMGMFEKFGGGGFSELQKFQLSPALQFALSVALSPFVYFVGTFIGAGVVHLLLVLFGGAPGGFATTLRVNAYCAATWVALVIPFLGELIGLVWWAVLLIFGLGAAHRISTGRSAAAVLIPVALCCVCLVVAILLFATTMMAALGAASS